MYQVPTTLPFFSMFYLNFGNKIALLVPSRNKSKACHKRLEGKLKGRKGVYVQRWWNLQENVFYIYIYIYIFFFPWGLSYGILNECKGPKEKDDWTWHRENNFSENWGKKLCPCSMIMRARGSYLGLYFMGKKSYLCTKTRVKVSNFCRNVNRE